jgi:hypothetical protein
VELRGTAARALPIILASTASCKQKPRSRGSQTEKLSPAQFPRTVDPLAHAHSLPPFSARICFTVRIS